MFKLLDNTLSPRLTRLLFLLFFSVLFGLAWYLLLYGPNQLYFTNINWIYTGGGDFLQHQLGWEWFRQEPWRFPLGRIETYGYPFGTYVSYMDSIPLMAIPLKLLSPWLENHFQYFGIWNLASFIGQMLFGMLILREFTRSYTHIILGASLLVLSPPMIARVFFGHGSLTAHWILLAAIWFILLEYRHKLWQGAWIILFALATLIHLYFVAFLLPLWAISLFFHYAREKMKWMIIPDILAVIGVILLIGYCIGLFSLKITDLSSDDYGYYSWNLNGFFNPSVISSFFFKRLVVGTGGQYEVFSYLGLVNMLIIPASLFLFLQNENFRRRLYFLLPFIIVSIPLCLFALSQKAFLGDQPLWNIPLNPQSISLFSLFHSCGRFIWPVFYFLVLFGLISILRYYRYPTIVLLLALLVQSLDLQKIFDTQKFTGFSLYKSPLQSEIWQQAANTNSHIILLPATWHALGVYEPIAIFARQNKLTLNWGYFSRADYETLKKYGDQALEDLQAGHADLHTIYIFYNSEGKRIAQEYLSDRMLICQVDGYELAFPADNGLAKTNIDLTHYCTVPPP
jgi:hypothetical protein